MGKLPNFLKLAVPPALAILSVLLAGRISEAFASIPFCLIFFLIGPTIHSPIGRKLAALALMLLFGICISQQWASFPLHPVVLAISFGAIARLLTGRVYWKLREWISVIVVMILPPLILLLLGKALSNLAAYFGSEKYQFFYASMFGIGALFAGYLQLLFSYFRQRKERQ